MSRSRGRGRTKVTRSPQVRPAAPPQDPPTRQLQITHYERSGPLPHPAELREFNDIVDNGAERIFLQWEGQADHRRKLETKVISADIWRGWAGIGVSAILDLIFLLVSWDLVRNDHDWGGAALALTATVHLSIGGVSLYTVRQRETNRQRRREQLEQEAGD